MSTASSAIAGRESQMLSQLDFNEIPSSEAAEQDAFSNYITLLTSQPAQDQGCLGAPEWNDVSPQLLHPFASSLAEVGDEELNGLFCVITREQSYDNSSSRSTEQSSPQPTNSTQNADLDDPIRNGLTAKRSPRKQNHSCDHCRTAKRACSLQQNVSIRGQKPTTPCTTCDSRGLECTVAWLVNRRFQQQTRKRPRTTSYSQSTDTVAEPCVTTCSEEQAYKTIDEGPSVLSREDDLARQLVGRNTLLQKFNLYVDVIDMPLSQCLLQGSMHPRYNLGIAALGPLSNSGHMSAYFDHANTWIGSCWIKQTSSWASTVVAPHLFHAVSVLDSLFQYNSTLPGRGSTSRDASITETYKLVTIATVAQFSISNHQTEDPSWPGQWDPHLYSRDIATSAWRKAKELLFKNISSVRSFRLAVSLLLFGLIPAPNPGNESSTFEEDAVFALCKGVRRIQMLCSQARACLLACPKEGISRCSKEKPYFVQMLPEEVRENILELIAAIERLSIMTNCMTVVLSGGKTCPLPPQEMCDTAIESPQRAKETNQASSPDVSSVVLLHDYEIDNSIVSRSKEGECALIPLLCKNSSEDLVLQAIRQSGAVEILLWICLACFTLDVENIVNGNPNYEAAHRRYTIAVRLVELWRLSFGTLNDKTVFCIERSTSDIRRLAGYCLNDANLAILSFCATAQRLDAYLDGQPSIPQT
ncbi:hypothetical protein F1880_010112 [Penicillium rolfsii]|nr:hypothetical protein F1880_010112 [Penicillium rolfsii]